MSPAAGFRTVESIDDGDLEAKIAVAAGYLNVANARLVELVGRALETGEWRGHRIHSPAQWLAWRAGLSISRAREIVQIASRRIEFPTIVGAFERGELAVDQVAAVTRAAPGWADAKLLDFAQAATVHQLRKMIRAENFEGDPTPAPAKPEPQDRLSTGHIEHGRWRINGEYDSEHGELVERALAEAKDALFRAGNTQAGWADALVEVCRRSLDSVASTSRRERYRVWWHLDADANAATTAGWKLPPQILERILCDGVVNPVWERDGLPVNIGRAQHIVPDRTRTVVERRDQGCRVPGCTHDRIVQVHHIRHWIDGGVTDTWNLICLCPKHHRLHHRGKLGITGNADLADGVTFTDEHGRTITANSPPIPPTKPPEPPAGSYRNPEGGRLDRNYVGLGWVHPDEMQRRRNAARQRQAS